MFIAALITTAFKPTHAAQKVEMVTITDYDFEKLEPDPLDPQSLPRVLRGHSHSVEGPGSGSLTLTIGTFRDVRIMKYTPGHPERVTAINKTSNDGRILSYQTYPLQFDEKTIKQFGQFIAATNQAASGGSTQVKFPAAFNRGQDANLSVSFLSEESNRTRIIDGIRYISSAMKMSSDDHGETWTVNWTPADKKFEGKAPTETYQYSIKDGEKRLDTFERDFNFKTVTRRAKKRGILTPDPVTGNAMVVIPVGRHPNLMPMMAVMVLSRAEHGRKQHGRATGDENSFLNELHPLF